MELDPIEPGALRATGGGGVELGEDGGEIGEVGVADPLAGAAREGLVLPFVEDGGEGVVVLREEPGADGGVVVAAGGGAVGRGEHEVAAEEGVARGTAADAQEVEDLQEQPGLATRGAAHDVGERGQPRDEAIVADPEQRPRGTSRIPVASTTIAPGAPARSGGTPGEDALADEAILGGAPRHHRRNPGAVTRLR